MQQRQKMHGLRRALCLAALLGGSLYARAMEYHGTVTLGGLPVPGAVVTAAQGSKKVVVVTDTQGLYSFADLADGSWTISVEMTGFASMQAAVAIAPGIAPGSFELKMQSLDQIRAAARPLKVTVDAPPVLANAPASPTPATKPPDTRTATASMPPPAAAPDENTARAADGLLINGSVNNAASSQFSQSAAFGNARNAGRSLYNGGIGIIFENSALDAKQYSLTGLDVAKPSYNHITGILTFGGPVKIPRLLPRGPNLFLAYQWTRNRNDTTQSALVPTEAERSGILPTGNVTPVPQAVALLSFYPLPNLAGSTRYNYQVPIVGNTHQDALQTRLDKSIGQRNQFFGGVAFQSSRTSGANLFGFVDTTDTFGLTTNVNWSRRVKQRLFFNTGYRFSRSRTQAVPFFANHTDVSGAAGITGNDRSPMNWGPPSLSFASGIAGLSDAQSAYDRSETNGLSESISWNRTRHNVTFGGDFRRQEFNYFAQQNPRGAFSFTGAATGTTLAGTTTNGSDFADFLLGIPDTSAIAFGNPDKYLRQSVYDAFITDDWRVRPDLTINFGIRWEYGAPITELKNRLVSLDEVANFAAVAPVLASSTTGALSGQPYPTSLIRPDKLGIEPRIGLSWRPLPGSSLLVRAGYGVYDDTSVYQATALALAQQAPLSKSLSVANSAACPLTLADGFTPCASVTQDTFAVDPNFRIGYAQTWQLAVQRDLPGSLQMTATYLGVKGTRGVQEFLPNTYPAGAANLCATCPTGFTYRTSNGDSTRESGSLQLRRRLHNGLTASLQYTFSKSLDDDYALGGQGAVAGGATTQSSGSGAIAQDWQHLSAERGLSTFDQRHLLNASAQYTTGQGIGGRSLMTGWKGALYKEWTVLTNISFGTGLPESPTYLAPVSGTGFTGVLRPNVTGAPLYAAPAGLFLNPAAYAAPASGVFGNARRDSITGPDSFTLNASLSRTFRLHDRYNLDIRADSTNALNHVSYNAWLTTVNSTQFGLPAGANGMRTVQGTARLRF